MGLHLFAKLQRVWVTWDVRCLILLSLFLQSFLLLIAPFRKRSSSIKIYGMIWLTYLVADWTALFAASQISDSQSANNASSGPNINEVMVFWSPFLLVHLGGPDTITAMALEDNELWKRHLLKLIGQLVSTGLVFYRSLPNNELLVPTILIFIAGTIKYSERIRSLHRASVKKVNNSLVEEADPGPNYAKLMEEYATRSEARMSVETKPVSEPHRPFKFLSHKRSDHEADGPSEREMIHVAYRHYRKFKGLVADLIFSRHDSHESREYLVKLKADKAFKVVDIELSFIYEVLYTKAIIIHDRSKLGYFFRFLYSVLILVTFGLWYFIDKSQHFSTYDVKITYTLLFGAVILDIISFSMLISSDWVTALAKMKEDEEDPTIRERCLVEIGRAMDKSKLAAHECLLKRAPRILSRRWSESIQQYNLIDQCLPGRRRLCDKLYEFMGIQDVMDDLRNVTAPEPFHNDLRDFIFKELKFKSGKAKELEDEPIYMARGEWVLKHCFDGEDFTTMLDDWVSKVEYDKSIILWHIATDLCYNNDKIHSREDPSHANETTPARNNKEEWQRKMSKIMSDYMLHLLIRESQMMADVSSIAQFRFRDTVEEANVFLHSLGMDPNDKGKRLLRGLGLDPKDERKRLHFICSNLLDVNTTDVPPRKAKGDRSNSVLFDGCSLAKELCKITKVNKWELICKVWVEMLSHAAVQCRGNVHAAQLGKGGQLLTLVWMLMFHLGLGKQFRIKGGNARIKLVADN